MCSIPRSLALCVLALIAACDAGTGEPGGAASAPTASGFQLSPLQIEVGVQAKLEGSVDVADPDGDLASLVLRVTDPTGDTGELTFDLAGAAGLTTGVAPISLDFTAAFAGAHTFEVTVVDAGGRRSGTLTRTVTAVGAVTRPPELPIFQFTPSTAVVGDTVSLGITGVMEDPDGDLKELRVRVLDPDGAEVLTDTRPFTATATGDARPDFSLTLTPAKVGTYKVEGVAADEAGNTSEPTVRNLTVTAVETAKPTIEQLDFAPRSVSVGDAVDIIGTVTVKDLDGDATELRIQATGPGNAFGAEISVPVDLDGGTSKVISFIYPFTAVAAGSHMLKLTAIDALGQSSSPVSGILSATTALPSNPVVSDLVLDNEGLQPGVPATLSGSIKVSDADGDAALLVIHLDPPSGAGPADAMIPIDLAGADSGTVRFSTPLDNPVAGTYEVQAWALDAAQRKSNIVSAELGSASTGPVVTAVSVQPLSVLINVARTLTGDITASDPTGDLDALIVRMRAPNGTVAIDTEVAVVANASKHPFSIPFTATTVGSYTFEVYAVDAAQAVSPTVTVRLEATDLTGVNDACAATNTDCTGEGFCYNVAESTCAYLAARNQTLDACDDVTPGASVPTCVSSVIDTTSPNASGANACTFVQYWANPTAFPIDCRCSASGFDNQCKRPYDVNAVVSFGSGPRIRDLAGEVRTWNGPIVGREWFIPVAWSSFNRQSQTMIFAIDIDTGNRRYVSGAYTDPAEGYTEIGAGPSFINVLDIKVGADGKLYAMGARSDIAPPKVWRVDPATGDRTLLFDEETAAPETLCPNGSTIPGRTTVQMVGEGWAMDAAGNHYFSIIGMPGPSVVKFPADFSACSYLTRVTTSTLTTLTGNVGAGYDVVQFNLRAFHVEGTKLYAVSDTKLLEVDLATGKRVLKSNAKEIGGLGAGPINAEGLGDRWTRWDPYRNVLWTVGALGMSHAVVVDLATGNRTTWPCWHPTMGLQAACNSVGIGLIPGYLNFGGFAIDPQGAHDLVFAHDLFAIVRYEVKTGNAYTLSL